jgi:uncharacterized small protein (DUF1192 family)
LPRKAERLGLPRSAREVRLFEDEESKKPKAHEVGMLLDTLSIEELRDRIGLLEGEIARLQAAIEAKQKSKSAAASVFKF